MRKDTTIAVSAALFVAALTPHVVQANGFGEERPYQFRTPDERIVDATIADLIERRRAGAFTQTVNIERQINCNQSSSAVGNTGSATHSGAGISPAGVIDSPLDSNATGNTGQLDSDVSGVSSFSGPLNGSAQNSTGGAGANSPFEVLVSDTAIGGLSSGGPQQVQDQDNTDSPITSSINDSAINGTVGDISADGADIDNVLNLTQSNDGSTINASINDSTTCSFATGAP